MFFSEINYYLVKKPSPLFLTGNIKLDGISSKTGWKIHACFDLCLSSFNGNSYKKLHDTARFYLGYKVLET